MAVLEKIRSKGVLVICIVGFAMLAFIIGDFLTSSSSILNASRDVVAEVNGKKIHYAEWQKRIDQVTDVMKIERGQSSLQDADYEQIRNQVWQWFVTESMLEAPCKALGITVTDTELSDNIIGKNPHQMIQRSRLFAGQDGQFDPSMPTQLASYLEAGLQEGADAEQFNMLQNAYQYYEALLRLTLLQEKYATFFSNASGANKLEAKASFAARQNKLDAIYVMQPYSTVDDSKVTVSDDEIKALYDKRKSQMNQEATRSIKYVTFNIEPSKEDNAEVEKAIKALKAEFDTTADIKGLVNANSDISYTGLPYNEETVPAQYKEFAFSNAAGAVTPVEFIDGSWTTARIMEAGIVSPDSVKLYHIALAGDKAKMADSLVNVLKAAGNANFAELAKQYSDVKQTADKGGELDMMAENQLDEAMRDSAFKKPVGSLFVMEQGQAKQIFLIAGYSAPVRKVKLAVLAQQVTAGNKTTSDIYNKAKQFAAAAIEGDFEQAAKDAKAVVMPAEGLMKGSASIANIGHSREVVRWAFNKDTKLNSISDVFDCNNTYVVAVLTAANDDKYASLEEATPSLKAELLRDKKAEQMIAAMSKYQTVDAAAAGLKLDVDSASFTFSDNAFGQAGMEPAVVGKASATAVNKTTAPIKGQNGVFMVKVVGNTPAGEKYDEKAELKNLVMQASYYAPQFIFQHLYKQADIEDNRPLFY